MTETSLPCGAVAACDLVVLLVSKARRGGRERGLGRGGKDDDGDYEDNMRKISCRSLARTTDDNV